MTIYERKVLYSKFQQITYTKCIPIEYITHHKILHCFQSGILKNHSTNFLLSNLTDDICKVFHLDRITILLLLDLSKAFDRVSYAILLDQLSAIGFSPQVVGWFSEYLRNHTQSVILDGESSSTLNIISGVPQGSVLGPLLFLIYINNLGRKITYSKRLISLTIFKFTFKCLTKI